MLCHVCTRLSPLLTAEITTWLTEDPSKRFSWRGKPTIKAGHHFRHVPETTSCSLCLQLRAPWIASFLRHHATAAQYEEEDQIHIFRHLRHLPHVNDFPESRNMLKEHNAPFHIAVVPGARARGLKWKDELREHISAQGIVAIFPWNPDDDEDIDMEDAAEAGDNSALILAQQARRSSRARSASLRARHNPNQEQEVFDLREVAPYFDPAIVQRSLDYCKSHSDLCNPKKPEVRGMRVINCHSPELEIEDYDGTSQYIALSYVWGASPLGPSGGSDNNNNSQGSEASTSAAGAQAAYGTRAAVRMPHHVPRAESQAVVTRFRGSSRPGSASSSTSTSSRARNRPRRFMPADIPGTIADAIEVTKLLHIRYLWVDQYCIDQDNDAEKQIQFAKMAAIYKGAQITIFALGADSNSGLPGVSLPRRSWHEHRTLLRGKPRPSSATFSFSRDPQQQRYDDEQRREAYTLVSTLPDPHTSIEQSAWSTRAWTFQEGLFSTRRLFFTPHQIYFECNAMNTTESLRSRMRHLHTRNRQRLRAFHRAGRFVCGNSNSFSHYHVRGMQKCHRKIDVVRRCMWQVRQYTLREMTCADDVLHAFVGVAEYYAASAAMIACLAGLMVPSPMVRMGVGTRSGAQEGLDLLSFALSWTHRLHTLTMDDEMTNPKALPARMLEGMPWSSRLNPSPQRRTGGGFPSWSWAGWYGEMASRHDDLAHCYSSLIGPGSVTIHFRQPMTPGQPAPEPMEYTFLQQRVRYKKYLIHRLLLASEIHLKAYTLDVTRLKAWEWDPWLPYHGVIRNGRREPIATLRVNMSEGPQGDWNSVYEKIVDGRLLCIVLGTYGEPRPEVIRAMRSSDGKSDTARLARIDIFERKKTDAIVCLVVKPVKGRPKAEDGTLAVERKGLIKIEFVGLDVLESVQITKGRWSNRTRRCDWEGWVADGTRRKFALV